MSLHSKVYIDKEGNGIIDLRIKEAANFCSNCGSIMGVPKNSKDGVEYCTNNNCENSKEQEKERKKREKYEKENPVYDTGNPGDSVLIKLINTSNNREYWSAQERKFDHPDGWIERAKDNLWRQLRSDDDRLPEEMRQDYKNGDNFIDEFQVYEGLGAFDKANDELSELGELAYHFMKKSPKNQYDKNLDNNMEEDQLMIPASFKRLIRKIKANNEVDISFEEIKEDVKMAINFMKKNVSQWAIRDTLKQFTSWGFYQGPVMESIDIETAGYICKQLEEYFKQINYNENLVNEIYDIIYHYART